MSSFLVVDNAEYPIHCFIFYDVFIVMYFPPYLILRGMWLLFPLTIHVCWHLLLLELSFPLLVSVVVRRFYDFVHVCLSRMFLCIFVVM